MSMQTYSDQPCPRCGSKQRISKTWKEKIPSISGVTIVDCMQIVCTNKTCQEAFDKNLAEETKKREAVKQKKEEGDRIRKENALQQALHARKDK